MDTKLTLSLNKTIIEQTKIYARSNQISLSKLIETYLASLTNKSQSKSEITPLVESLSGVINLDDAMDLKKDYHDFLLQKYK